MKISVLLVDGGKQIMITPETDHEKSALKMIAPSDVLEIQTKASWGTFTDGKESYGVKVDKCHGGYYRGYTDEESLIFLIENKSINTKEEK